MKDKSVLTKQYSDCCGLGIEVETNGFQGGDHGHGGYIKLWFKDFEDTGFVAEGSISNGQEVFTTDLSSIRIKVMGDAEMRLLAASLRDISKFLEIALNEN